MVATNVEKNTRGTQVFKTQVPPFTFPTPVLLLFSLFSPPARDSSSFPILLSSIPCFFFFFPYSTSSDLCSPQRSSDLVLFPSFLVLHLHRHRCSYGTRVFKTQVPCDKNISMSAIKTRVFGAPFLCCSISLLNSSLKGSRC